MKLLFISIIHNAPYSYMLNRMEASKRARMESDLEIIETSETQIYDKKVEGKNCYFKSRDGYSNVRRKAYIQYLFNKYRSPKYNLGGVCSLMDLNNEDVGIYYVIFINCFRRRRTMTRTLMMVRLGKF